MPGMYQKLIHEIDPSVNPAGVEAAMRYVHGTLNHLSRQAFENEVLMARLIDEEQPGRLRDWAFSLGLTGDYDAWETGR